MRMPKIEPSIIFDVKASNKGCYKKL